ncbi:MAG: hypothetical protein ABIY70_06805 [Capsulimonas sp.]|uniref:hypothetical protein n=1 Tax=Capsulimonas sp. TaxID=2494211 RepID=UPI00326475E8
MKLAYAPVIAGIASLMSSTSTIAAPALKYPLTLDAKFVPSEKLDPEISHSYKAYSEVECTVTNVSNKTILLGENASIDINWTTDNKLIGPVRTSCGANMVIVTKLAPGKTYTKRLPISFGNLKTGEKIKFELQFHSNIGNLVRFALPQSADQSPTPDIIASCSLTTRVPGDAGNDSKVFAPGAAGSYITPISSWRKSQSWGILNYASTP